MREIIDIDTNYMEDETTGLTKQKNSGELDKDENSKVKMRKILILL